MSRPEPAPAGPGPGPAEAIPAETPAAPIVIAGTQAEIAVPPPGSDSTSSVPAMRLTRSRIALRPKPPSYAGSRGAPGSKPAPSSRTSSVTMSSM